jgi:hypothetical protein
VRGKCYAGGNHEHDDGEFLARFLDAECPGDEEDSDGGEGLGVIKLTSAEQVVKANTP